MMERGDVRPILSAVQNMRNARQNSSNQLATHQQSLDQANLIN